MTIDLTKRIETADGRPVSILADDIDSPTPLVAVITNPDNSQVVNSYTVDGVQDPAGEAADVLVNVPVVTTQYVNYYGTTYMPDAYGSSGAATSNALSTLLATIVLTWTDGVITGAALE